VGALLALSAAGGGGGVSPSALAGGPFRVFLGSVGWSGVGSGLSAPGFAGCGECWVFLGPPAPFPWLGLGGFGPFGPRSRWGGGASPLPCFWLWLLACCGWFGGWAALVGPPPPPLGRPAPGPGLGVCPAPPAPSGSSLWRRSSACCSVSVEAGKSGQGAGSPGADLRRAALTLPAACCHLRISHLLLMPLPLFIIFLPAIPA
jgi:hypothetical protein